MYAGAKQLPRTGSGVIDGDSVGMSCAPSRLRGFAFGRLVLLHMHVAHRQVQRDN